MPIMTVKVYIITPHDKKLPECLVYEDSEDNARASCTTPAKEKNTMSSPELVEDNAYTDETRSDCAEQVVAVTEEHQYNGGTMIDFDYKNKTYPLQKGDPEYL